MNDAIDIAAVAAIGAIGRPLRRKEDHRLLTGKGRFTDDFNMGGQAHAVMVRSPHPHARILHGEGVRAKQMPGVLGAFSGQDCLADGLAPIPHNPVPSTRYDLKLTDPPVARSLSVLNRCCRWTRCVMSAKRLRWSWPKPCGKRSM